MTGWRRSGSSRPALKDSDQVAHVTPERDRDGISQISHGVDDIRSRPHDVDTIPVDHYLCAFQFGVLAMKKMTTTLPEDLARWLHVKAAEDDRSVSLWIAELLVRMRRREDDYQVTMKRYLAMEPRKIEWPERRKPTREELCDRAGLR